MSKMITWIVRNSLWIVVIIIILGGVAFIVKGVKELDSTNGSIGALRQALDDLGKLQSRVASDITSETQSIVGQSLGAQRQLLADVNREIDALLPEAGSRSQLLVLLALGKGEGRLEAHVHLELLRQQRKYLEMLIRHTAAMQEVEAARRALESLRQQHIEVFRALEANREAQRRIRDDNWGPDWNPFSDGYEELQQLEAEEAQILRNNKAAHDAFQQQKAVVERKSMPTRPDTFGIESEPIDALRTEIADEARRLQKQQGDNVAAQVAAVFAPWVKPALWLWAAALVTPYALRTLFYWVLAPVATRLPPIRVERSPKQLPVPTSSESAVSVPITFDRESELLVKNNCLQTISQTSERRTQWLLNASFPVTSLASGLWELTRVRSNDGEPTMVMVSCQDDALGEVGLVHLPAGATMVVQPRSLAGVLKPRDTPVNISRRWRLDSLHAWMTLQLRYLIFHGPCTLIVKGCRGIRTEAPSVSSPRLIRQSATMAFSANLNYQTIRHATFVPYLRGQEDLFCDLFSGGPGIFVYEEMPSSGLGDRARKGGADFVLDTVRKVFGI